jgi:hypothetical protein
MKRKTPEGDTISVYADVCNYQSITLKPSSNSSTFKDIVLTRGDKNLFEVVGAFERILVLPEE